MPKVHEEIINIRVFKLVKNDQDLDSLINDDLIQAMTDVVENLLEDHGVVVEVEKQ